MKIINSNEEWHYKRQVNLDFLAIDIEKWLESKKYTTQRHKAPDKNLWLIQARKSSFFRSVIASNRAFSIIIEGEPNEFYIKTGVSEWISNLPTVILLTICTGGLLAIVAGTSAAWTKKLQFDIKNYIRERILFGAKSSDGENPSDLYLSPTEALVKNLEKEYQIKLAALKNALEVGAIDQNDFNNKKKYLTTDLELSKKLIAFNEAKKNGVINDEEFEKKKNELMQML